MKFSRRRLLLAVLVCAVALAAWGLLRPHGPTYQGRDVRGWLELRAKDSGPHGNFEFKVMPEVLSAFRLMGTNAFPELIGIALERKSPPNNLILGAWLRERVPSLEEKLPLRMQEWLREPSSFLPKIALAALDELRPPAALIFPRITNELTSSLNIASSGGKLATELKEYRRQFLLRMMGYVGSEQETAARILAPFLVTTNQGCAEAAGEALSRLGPAAAVAVPQVIAWLTNATDSFQAVACLRDIGPGASNALPALRRAYEASKMTRDRVHIMDASFCIGPSGGWGEVKWREMLAVTADKELRKTALYHLGYYTFAGQRFEKELEVLAHTDQTDLAVAAIWALAKANPESARTVPVLSEGLLSTNATVRASAAGWLLGLQPTNALAFDIVTNGFADPHFHEPNMVSVSRYWLLTCLAKLGPAAAPALPFIRQYYSEATPGNTNDIAKAIQAIEGKP